MGHFQLYLEQTFSIERVKNCPFLEGLATQFISEITQHNQWELRSIWSLAKQHKAFVFTANASLIGVSCDPNKEPPKALDFLPQTIKRFSTHLMRLESKSTDLKSQFASFTRMLYHFVQYLIIDLFIPHLLKGYVCTKTLMYCPLWMWHHRSKLNRKIFKISMSFLNIRKFSNFWWTMQVIFTGESAVWRNYPF